MSKISRVSSRRAVLKLSGVALASLAGSGVASADHEHPDVETDPGRVLSASSAELNGDLLEIGDSADFASVWFEWGPKYEDGFPNMTTSEVVYSPGEFSDTISGLERGDYKFRAAAKDSDDIFTFFGDARYFTAGDKQ